MKLVKNLSRIIIILLLALLTFALWFFRDSSQQYYLPEKINHSPQKPDTSIIFISDTQSPIWAETIVLSKNDNEIIREKIFNEILKKNPSAVFHLGDLVSLGFDNNDWSEVDSFISRLNEKRISFYPTLGNHELILFPTAGEANFLRRFPWYSKTGYQVRIDSVAVILLNSNFTEMSIEELKYQQRWYENKLVQFENDPSIKLIIVGCHHSPFTNSKIVSPSNDVQKYFVPPFLKSNKAKLFVGGHAHAFEHFKIDKKDFIVIGGGGGLQQPLYTDNESKWKDNFASTEIRRFHFAQFNTKKLELRIVMVDSLYNNFETVYKLSLK